MYLQLIKWSPSLNFTSLLTVNNIDNTFYFFINAWFFIPLFIKVLRSIISIFIKVLNAIKFNLSKICLNLHFVYLVKIKGEDMFKISQGFTICYLIMCLIIFSTCLYSHHMKLYFHAFYSDTGHRLYVHKTYHLRLKSKVVNSQ